VLKLLHRSNEIEEVPSSSSSSVSEGRGEVEFDSVLKGTTLRIYRLIITTKHPLGPREIQRTLKLNSHTIAVFHLEKLARHGLILRNEMEGTYTVNRLHLKHYFLLRRRLIPRYFLYATLFTAVIGGWIAILLDDGLLSPSVTSFSPSVVFEIFLFGIGTAAISTGIFWYETTNVIRNDKL
jgi:hypothetical protein